MNIPSKFWTVATGLLGILFVFALLLSIKSIKELRYVGTNPANTSTINVDGTGHAIAVPDIATFSFSVSETGKTVAEAQTKATDRINSALKTIRGQGVADKDISTQSYNINPHYEYQRAVCPATSPEISYCPGSKSVLTGYDVSQSIEIKVRDISKAGAILASIGSLGVQNVSGLNFSVDEPAKVQAEARNKAITDAKSKADVLAKQLGVSLVRVVSFSENSGGYPRPMYSMEKVMGAGVSAPAAPEIPAGEQKVTSNVSITYEIQ